MALRDIILAQSGLKSFWEGTDALGSSTLVDVNGAAHNGTFQAGVAPGMPGFDNQLTKAWRYSGANTDNGVTFSNHADFNSTTMSFELCYLALQQFSGIETSLWTKGNDWFRFIMGNSGSALTPRVATNVGAITTGSATITDTHLWHHLAFTCNGAYNTIKLYLDGVDITGSYTSRTLTANTNGAQIGTNWQKALICNAAYYSTVLSQSDITARWNAVQAERNRTKAKVIWGVHSDVMFTDNVNKTASKTKSAATINAGLVRNGMLWHHAQLTNGGAYDWSTSDEAVRVCNIQGTIPWFVFLGSPTWANGGAGAYNIPGVGVDATFLTFMGKWQTFAADFVNRYKPGGAGPYTIPGDRFWVEIYNEPNLTGFWNNTSANTNQQRADQMAYFYRNIRSTILANYSGAKVVFPGLSSWVATGGTDIAGETYFRNVLGSSSWSAAPIDYMAYHPYTAGDNPDNITSSVNHFNDILACRTVMAELGYGASPLIISEVGVTSGTSQADQATKMSTMMTRVRDEWSNFCPAFIFFVDSDETASGYGLFTTTPNDGTLSTARKTAALTFSGIAKPPAQILIAG